MDAAMTDQVTGSKLKWLWLSVAVIALDLGTKALATAMLTYGDPVPVMPMFNLTLLHNTGAAFSFLAGAAGWQRWFFVALAIVVSVVLIYWLKGLKRNETWAAVAIALILGGAITLYAVATLLGLSLRALAEGGRRGEAAMGAIAGLFGGLSGVWGPPTVAMLTARGTAKADQMRIQGVIYGLGSVALLWAHIVSGVLDAKTAPLSVMLIAPAILGLWLGFYISDRIDHNAFRKLTLLVLLIAGLNLVRRGIMAF